VPARSADPLPLGWVLAPCNQCPTALQLPSCPASHGKTTTTTLVATLPGRVNGQDPTAVIVDGSAPFRSQRAGRPGPLLVAEADESDGSLVKLQAQPWAVTNLELESHRPLTTNLEKPSQDYPDLSFFADAGGPCLATSDCPVLPEHLSCPVPGGSNRKRF